jgi:hypothetical protein
MENDSYNETGEECKTQKGSICWNYVFDGIFKPIYWGHSTCDKVEDNLDLILEA